MKDLFGKAILDYQTNSAPENIITSTSISEEDEMEVAYLFRSFDEMPAIEQKALQLAKGRTLDVGCGAGSHGLYLQNERNIDVHSIDISKNAIQACSLRGLKNTQVIYLLKKLLVAFSKKASSREDTSLIVNPSQLGFTNIMKPLKRLQLQFCILGILSLHQ